MRRITDKKTKQKKMHTRTNAHPPPSHPAARTHTFPPTHKHRSYGTVEDRMNQTSSHGQSPRTARRKTDHVSISNQTHKKRQCIRPPVTNPPPSFAPLHRIKPEFIYPNLAQPTINSLLPQTPKRHIKNSNTTR